MKLILTGATGFAGGEVLRQALADPEIELITVLTRGSTGLASAKLKEIILDDFLDYSRVDLAGYDACIWCLGVSQTQVDEAQYIRITLGYTVAAARAMYAANRRLRFCFLSGRGADPSEKHAALFSRIKGRTERQLVELGGPVFNFRPGYIRPSAQSGPRKDLMRLFAPIGALISLFNDDFSVECDQLGRCLLDVAKRGADRNLLLNRAIQTRHAGQPGDCASSPPHEQEAGKSKLRNAAAMPAPARKTMLTRLLAWLSLIVTTLLAVLLSAFAISGCTAFGGKPTGERLARAQQSPHWHDGHFENAQPLWADGYGAWSRLLFGPSTPNVVPDAPIPVVHTSAAELAKQAPSGLRVTWFGHSSALVEIDGTRVLVDPFWSGHASPVTWAGPDSWYAPPIALDQLPRIDVVIISHDHVDHLDYATIVAMKSWPTVFVVPLGVGAHLSKWGIPDSRIVELDWWQATRVGELELIATPARHGSGRITTKTNRTLWAGYALIGARHRVWYSGDTGIHDDLPRIGERLGPFDVTLIEAGQYDALWPDTHLGPEQAVEAHRLVRGKVMMPVHWGLLKLAEHAWTEPAERVLAAAQCRGVKVLVPRPGESIEPTQLARTTRWWPRLPWRTANESAVIGTKNGVPSERVAITSCS